MGMPPEQIAAVAHGANIIYRTQVGEAPPPAFADLPDERRQRIANGVRFVLDNRTAGDDAQHRNWLAFMEAKGWRHGDHEDAEAKTHPCMLPFDQLPPHQQAKDRLFRAVVLALAPALDAGEENVSDPRS